MCVRLGKVRLGFRCCRYLNKRLLFLVHAYIIIIIIIHDLFPSMAIFFYESAYLS